MSHDPVEEERETEPCVICLDPIEDPATLPCLHVFCFVCVVTAAETFSLSTCAVCRTPFSSVRHRGVDEPVLIPSSTGVAEESSPRAVSSHRDRRRRRDRRHRRSARRKIYLRRLFAQPLVEQCLDGAIGRKDTSPEFYKQNPAALHPLVPFMHRDLRLFLSSPQAKQLEKSLIEKFKQYDIKSRTVTEYLEPFLGRFAVHFQHEVRNFAQSICDQDKYDRLVLYQRRISISPIVQEL